MGAENEQLATFAGGCFWCMVKPFDQLPGIVSVVSGYTGGHSSNPTYDEVASETTGHAEAVQITFQPALFPYGRLLDIYWQLIDPTDKGGQFQDRGYSYRTAIFVHNEEQREQAVASKLALKASGRFKGPIVTEIVQASTFYPAEEYHQDYYKTHIRNYNLYRDHSGRNEFAAKYWHGKKDRERLRKQLTDIQFEVTQNKTTEPAFENEYWANTDEGIYADIVSGDPLFSSKDKFDSGTGWPTFLKPLEEGFLTREADFSSGLVRTAIRSRLSNAHLGYLMQEGHPPYYRINSASLRFIPKNSLEREGYGRYVYLFA
ncbi:peptide-methionine (S)-S-oxide reductase MsrA [Paenibacillus sp. R14(2021)]|uniref:peptide-methionine (S)-S-oxide reductase MsrA n=1 Tax=Paenibacillus sp. R14(2021) TaxID=2859228 RepID=UPI001C614A82|nr:peptide-methionine (S)-S-oxide reductase MsrA [Paenibacillus sp. R14(2021)]